MDYTERLLQINQEIDKLKQKAKEIHDKSIYCTSCKHYISKDSLPKPYTRVEEREECLYRDYLDSDNDEFGIVQYVFNYADCPNCGGAIEVERPIKMVMKRYNRYERK